MIRFHARDNNTKEEIAAHSFCPVAQYCDNVQEDTCPMKEIKDSNEALMRGMTKDRLCSRLIGELLEKHWKSLRRK